jgi:exodeoxyribonuclease VII small subunit
MTEKKPASAPPAGDSDAKSLEEALNRLEEIAKRLEKGDLPLEESLRLFEEGVALTRRLDARLAEAEMKVEALLRSAGGEERAVPFEPPREVE